jgi:hypothetical protein
MDGDQPCNWLTWVSYPPFFSSGLGFLILPSLCDSTCLRLVEWQQWQAGARFFLFFLTNTTSPLVMKSVE